MNNNDTSVNDGQSNTVTQQQRILADRIKDVASLKQQMRQNLQMQNAFLLRLRPPVRPDRDATQISALIDKKNAELDAIEKEILEQNRSLAHLYTVQGADETIIAQGQRNLAHLKQELATNNATVERLRSLLSPIRVLPVELLMEIFDYCRDAEGTISLFQPPLLISHICSSWRTIAINKPELWSILSLTSDCFATKAHGIIPLSKLWIERSRNAPLTLYMRPDDNLRPGPGPSELFFAILELFIPHYHRWKSITLEHPRFFCTDKLFSALPNLNDASFPMLETFNMHLRCMTSDDAEHMSGILLRSSPRLREVSWMVNFMPRDPILPYQRLTKLELGGEYDINEALEIISLGTHLLVIDMTISIPFGMAANIQHIEHKSLHTVSLACEGPSMVVLDSLTLPSLKHLDLKNITAQVVLGSGTWPRQSLLALLQRSKASLTSLSHTDYSPTSDGFIELLRQISPNLEKLEMDLEQLDGETRFVTDSVLKALTYPTSRLAEQSETQETDNTSPILCPKLQWLRLVGCIASTDGVLADMAESRCRPPEEYPGLAKLRSAMFGLDSRASPQDISRIRLLRDNFMILDEATG